ncbi:Protein CBG05988 [Caenorhabditis briggsae]|uniref:Protein CBG05988 n=1 Tax=Caenorhabditis briggsae TaxID=6238 RepID=A8X163_CAEBR|nr:Protein CBG05988 [Caenorhabditis briggsae]CAP26373.1 Protein CBG05988 [Caenorhabditis briggsae]
MPSNSSSAKCCTLLCHINTRIALTIVDILIGISNILSYAIQFHNWSALILTSMVTLVACHTLQMFLAEKKCKITNWEYGTFQCILIIDLYGENLWFTGLWATAITKYTWQNAFLARNYGNMKRKLESRTTDHESEIAEKEP